MNRQELFAGFPETSAKAWKQKIQVDLKGADYNETLIWESPEGIKVRPFYNAEDLQGEPVNIPKKKKGWTIGEALYVANGSKTNASAKLCLQKGTESLLFSIPSTNIVISDLLAGILSEAHSLHFSLKFLSTGYLSDLIAHLGASSAQAYLHLDPIGNLARSGNWHTNQREDLQKLAESIKAGQKLEKINVLGIDLSLYQNAGANIVQQLAYALGHANEYLTLLEPKTLGCPAFTVAIGTNYFFEIAKLRALRLLWATLATEYGLSEDCHILAIPSRRNKTLYDYNTNMLRTTTESMSAVLGGADTVLNQPYDAIYHKSNDFGERIARNQLLILKNESHFDKVSNPADGAYYLEKLTAQLAGQALKLFKQIEAGGGFLNQLKDHNIQRKIRENANREEKRFAEKKEILIGSNTYENAADRMGGELELYPFVKTRREKTLIEPIIEKRLAEELEQKRLKNE